MTASPSPASMRAGALALLASGNSLESVAHVFGVPVETLQSWAARPTQALPADATAATAPTPPWAVFPGTATYAMGTMGRFAGFALVPLMLVGPVFAVPFVHDGTTGGAAVFVLFIATLACLAAAACLVRYVTNARFVLQPHVVTGYRFGDGVSLPLARIEALTATRQPRSTFYTIELHAKGGGPSLKIHPEYRHLRDDALFTWLTSIPKRGGVPISGPESNDASLVMSVIIGLVVLAGILGMASGPIGELRGIVSGYPPLEQLSLAEGTLTRVESCHPGGKGYSAYLPITLATAGGAVHESVGCDLGPALRARGGDHHVSVWRDKRAFADGHVRAVDMDGRVLQSYADYIARSRRIAPFSLLAQLMLMSTLVLFGLGFILSNREN